MTEQETDELLMESARQGDLSRLAVIFERHARRLFGFLHGLVGSRPAAEDLVQETFLRVLRHRHSYRADRPFLPWLLAIARNAAWGHLTRQARHPRVELDDVAAAGSPEARSIDRQRAERLARALGDLPPRDREVLLLSYWEGLGHRQIAGLVGSTPGAVKVRAHRARRALRDLLAAVEKRP